MTIWYITMVYSYTININSSSRGAFLYFYDSGFSLEEKVFVLVGGKDREKKTLITFLLFSAFYGYSSRINIRYGYDMNMAVLAFFLLLRVHTTSPCKDDDIREI